MAEHKTIRVPLAYEPPATDTDLPALEREAAASFHALLERARAWFVEMKLPELPPLRLQIVDGETITVLPAADGGVVTMSCGRRFLRDWPRQCLKEALPLCVARYAAAHLRPRGPEVDLAGATDDEVRGMLHALGFRQLPILERPAPVLH